jgi:hypothetical protein
VKHSSKLPIDHLWHMFTTKFNKVHNLEKPGDAKLPEQLKVFSTKVSEDIFKMFGGDKDFNHMKEMPHIAQLKSPRTSSKCLVGIKILII